MKTMRKVFALLMALSMILALAISANAAGEKITITAAQKDATYKAYKIFDATVDANDNTKISYTIPTGSTVANIEGFSDVFETTTSGGLTYVTAKGTETEIVNWLVANKESLAAGSPVASVTNTDGATSVDLTVNSEGYFYITSDVGTKSAVMVTSTNPNPTINDKVETTPIVPDNAKTMTINGETVSYADVQLGQTVNFKVEFTATNYVTEDGQSIAINEYSIADKPDGFDIDDDTVAVSVNGDDYSIAGKSVTHSVDATSKELTVTIPWDQVTYPSPSTITVTYSATLTKITNASNKATVSKDGEPIGESETEVYNYTVDVLKVDAENKQTTLSGAEFAIKNADNKYYAIDNNVVSWVDEIGSATTSVTGEDGKLESAFTGLASGTYYLVEVTAPAGYNLAADTEFELAAISAEVTDTTTLSVSSTVEDAKGVELPSTGGIGTTIFTVVGATLMIGAAVLFITKKRSVN